LSRQTKLEIIVGRTNDEPFILDPASEYSAATHRLPALSGWNRRRGSELSRLDDVILSPIALELTDNLLQLAHTLF
jgi:hypothetical protein